MKNHRELIKTKEIMTTYNLTNHSSYGSEIHKTPILKNVTIDEVKEKFLEVAGRYCSPIFDRNFSENSNNFTLPNGYSTFFVKAV